MLQWKEFHLFWKDSEAKGNSRPIAHIYNKAKDNKSTFLLVLFRYQISYMEYNVFFYFTKKGKHTGIQHFYKLGYTSLDVSNTLSAH